MKTKHTPGPWWFSAGMECYAVGAGDTEIATVTGPNDQADARLIRAAPELLAELRATADFLEGICITVGPQAAAFTRQQLDRVSRARATIEKATKGT